MEYISTRQMAEKWKISSRRIQILCNEGRIHGAMRVGRTWVIPENTKKPSDQRAMNGKRERQDSFDLVKAEALLDEIKASFLMDNSFEYNTDTTLSEEKTLGSVRGYIIKAQKQVYKAVNSAMVDAYWNIGKLIHEACGGDDRAGYGKRLLHFLSEKLTAEFGKGFDESNLGNMRRFYISFPKYDALRRELSWTHYRSLMRVPDEKARTFYMEEAARAGWSCRQLDRQINSFYYQRLLSSRDKSSVAQEIERLEPRPEYEKIIKDPYVLEFLNLPPNEHYYESEMEEALINHLQKFLLELGRGYSFVARQKHFVVDDEHFYIDLVFYNYILKCFVLVDLKVGKLTHQDLGQMQMYVNYYTRRLMNEGDNPPIGIVLCADKSDTLVEYTLPEGNSQIYAAKYLPYLPTKEELRRELKLDDFVKLK